MNSELIESALNRLQICVFGCEWNPDMPDYLQFRLEEMRRQLRAAAKEIREAAKEEH